MMQARRTTILLVDQGVSFGGSLVVAAHLARSIDPSRFRTIIVGEADPVFIEHRTKGTAELRIIRHGFNYALWGRVHNFAMERIRVAVARKIFLYSISALRALVNGVYGIRLAVLVARERVDVVHLNNGLTNVEAYCASVILGRATIVHAHGLEPHGVLARYFLRRADRVIAISDAVALFTEAEGVDAERIVTIPNPVAPDPVLGTTPSETRATYGIAADAQVVGIFGRIVRWKGQLEFLRAASLVLARLPKAVVVVVGDAADSHDDYGTEVLDFIRSEGIAERVVFTGFVADVGRLYEAMDLVVHASIEPEPFGLVITEAMSHGIPVIASPLGAPSEIIKDEDHGFLIHPAETVRLAAVIERLLNDKSLRTQIGARGRAYVLAAYDLTRFARSVESVYSQVLEERST